MGLEKECRQKMAELYLIEEEQREERGCAYENFLYHPSNYLSEDGFPTVPTELPILSHLF